MRSNLIHLGLISAALTAGGCITYPADNAFLDGGEIRTLHRELKDLEFARDRGAISQDEFDRAEQELQSDFRSGSAIVKMSRMLSPEEAAKSIAQPEGTVQKPLHHSVDSSLGSSTVN